MSAPFPSTGTRFEFRFTGASRAMRLLGLTPRNCYVDVAEHEVDVKFGWAFRCRFACSSIESAADDNAPVRGWGAHGWRHVWLVNATSRDILRIDLQPMARGRVLLFPLRVRALRVGVDDRERLRAALGFGGPDQS